MTEEPQHSHDKHDIDDKHEIQDAQAHEKQHDLLHEHLHDQGEHDQDAHDPGGSPPHPPLDVLPDTTANAPSGFLHILRSAGFATPVPSLGGGGNAQGGIEGQTRRTAVDLCSGCGGLAEAVRELDYEHMVLVELV